MDNNKKIDSSEKINFFEISKNEQQKKPEIDQIYIVGQQVIEDYQGTYNDWHDRQSNNTLNIYKKMEVIKEDPPLSKLGDKEDKSLNSNEEIVKVPSDKDELIEDDFVEISNNPVKIEEKPISNKSISGYFWSTFKSVGSGLSSITNSVTQKIYSHTSVVSKKPLMQDLLTPVQKELYDYIEKFSHAPKAACDEMLELFKKVPESFIEQDVLPNLKIMDELSIKRLNLLKQGKDFGEEDLNFFQETLKDFRMNIGLKLDDMENVTKAEKQLLGKFIDVVSISVKNSNDQVFTDGIKLGCYSPRYAFDQKIDSATLGRYLDGVNDIKMKYSRTEDPSMKFLAENGFIPRQSTPVSCYNSCSWEMEIGKDLGNYRLFEKGYCKIGLAIPSVDLKEIRVPVDLRFLELSSKEELLTILSMISQVVSTDEEGRSKFFTTENIKNELLKGGQSLLEKCTEPKEKFVQLVKMLEYVGHYTTDALEKGLISLGRPNLHFDEVIDLFEVFPKGLIEKECDKDNKIKDAYKEFLVALHDFRKNNIENFLESKTLPLDFEGALKRYVEAFQTLSILLHEGTLTSQEKEAIKNYLDYQVEFTLTGWNEKSDLTHAESIKKILGDWKDLLGLKEWPEGMNIEIAQMLSDPTTCRLVADYIHYAKIAKEENISLLKNEGEVPMYAFHNVKMRSLCSNLFEAVGSRVEPLKKEQLMNLFGVTLLNVYVKPPRGLIENAHYMNEMVEVWNKENKSLKLEKINESPTREELGNKCIEMAIEMLPVGMPEVEKNAVIKALNKNIFPETYRNDFTVDPLSLEDLTHLSYFLKELKQLRQQGLMMLGYELGPKTYVFNMYMELLKKNSSFTFFTESLIAIEDRIGQVTNTQITNHSYPQASFHPRHVLINKMAGLRALNNWNENSMMEDIQTLKTPRESVKAVIKSKFEVRAAFDYTYNYMKILWHMDEGKVDTDESRIFQRGSCEILAAIPTSGDIRSCRVSIDFTPFQLKTREEIFEVTKCISQIMDAPNQQLRKERAADFIEEWRNEGQFKSIVDNAELFIATVLQYAEGMDRALSKVMNSVGDPNVHYSDVEELGDKIPLMMLKDKCLSDPQLKERWDEFLLIAGKGIDFQKDVYLNKSNGLFLMEINNPENELLQALEKNFENKEDLQVVKNYVQKVKDFAIEKWDINNNHQLRLMEKAVLQVAEMEGSLKDEKRMMRLKEILFPLLIEGNALGAFNEWLRAFGVAKKANTISGYDPSAFHNERLLKKEKELLVVLSDRIDLSNLQKMLVQEWMQSQSSK